MNIVAAIERFVTEQLLDGNRGEKLDPDQSLITSGILNSLALLELIGFIEDHFDITVESEEMLPENFQTINAMKAFIEGKREQRER